MKKLVYEITIDGEKTNLFYVADSKEDAIKKHIKRCAELYWITCNKEPDIGFFDGIDAKQFVTVYD